VFFFVRNRYPGYCPYSSGNCLGSLLTFLVVATLLAVCIAYFGLIVLAVFLAIGAGIGLICAIISYIKAIPSSVNDAKYYAFIGNRLVVFLKRVGYFHICLGKYSIQNAVDIARKSFQKAQPKALLSFSKWLYLSLGITTLVGSVVVLVLILLASIAFVCYLILSVLSLAGLAVLALALLHLLIPMWICFKQLVLSCTAYFFPTCFLFQGKRKLRDIVTVLQFFLTQVRNWISASYQHSAAFANNLKQSTQYQKWLSPKRILAYNLWLVTPVGATIAIGISAIFAFVLFIPCYIINTLFILVRCWI